MKVFLSLALVCCFACVAYAQGTELSVDQFRKLVIDAHMRFEDYKTTNTFSGIRHPPILDTPLKRSFRTVLTNAVKSEPNFDGKYVVASWCCGTNCQYFAIINLETGVVTEGHTTEWGLVHRADSSLLIVNNPDTFLKENQWLQGVLPS